MNAPVVRTNVKHVKKRRAHVPGRTVPVVLGMSVFVPGQNAQHVRGTNADVLGQNAPVAREMNAFVPGQNAQHVMAMSVTAPGQSAHNIKGKNIMATTMVVPETRNWLMRKRIIGFLKY